LESGAVFGEGDGRTAVRDYLLGRKRREGQLGGSSLGQGRRSWGRMWGGEEVGRNVVRKFAYKDLPLIWGRAHKALHESVEKRGKGKIILPV